MLLFNYELLLNFQKNFRRNFQILPRVFKFSAKLAISVNIYRQKITKFCDSFSCYESKTDCLSVPSFQSRFFKRGLFRHQCAGNRAVVVKRAGGT
jgi:hypothetical protein